MNKLEKFFVAALNHVDSKSVRDWATSTNNRPILVKAALPYVGGGKTANGPTREVEFATFLTCLYLDGPA
jgi:hypothetical protein